MTTALTQPTQAVRHATDDQHLVALWLHDKAPNSQRAYGRDVARFLDHVGHKQLATVTLGDLQSFADSLSHLSANTRKRTVSSVKSLLTFDHKPGYLPFNVGAALKAPKAKNTLAERILTEDQVMAMIHGTKNDRDRLLIRLLYASGGRVSELCALKWRDVQPNGESGQVTLFGKGGETRAVKISAATYGELLKLRGDAGADDPVFRSRKGGHLHIVQAGRIVRAAAERAGVPGNVSPHWFRHSHASHALERGASIALVRDTLGHSSLAVTSMYTHAKPGDSSALHLVV